MVLPIQGLSEHCNSIRSQCSNANRVKDATLWYAQVAHWGHRHRAIWAKWRVANEAVERSTGGDPNLDGEAPARLSGCDFYRFHGPGLRNACLLQLRDTVIESDEVLRQLAVIG